jgi:hypothetical protein
MPLPLEFGRDGSIDLIHNDGEPGTSDSGIPTEHVIANGSWEGRDGHGGEGSVSLVRKADQSVELRIGEDFSASPVPGPVVVLSFRESLGSSIDSTAGDLDLGTLTSAKGAQTYAVPGGDGGRRYAWVFCEPFGVEIARAPLKDAP